MIYKIKMISSSVLPPIYVSKFFIILVTFVLLTASVVPESTSKTSVSHTSKKIIIDSEAKSYSAIENTSTEKDTLSTPEEATPKQNPILSLFHFFLKSSPEVCPCTSQMLSLDFEDEKKKNEYLDFLEEQKQPIRIQENTDQYLETMIQMEIEKLKALLVAQKAKSLNEVSENRERLMKEMVRRALDMIKVKIENVVKDSKTFPEDIAGLLKKVELLENLDKTQDLAEIMMLKNSKLSFYVKHFRLLNEIQNEMKEKLWKYFPNSKLNEHSKNIFSKNSENMVSGVKLVILNGKCTVKEDESEMYLRFLDSLWVNQEDNLFDTHGNKVVWVYEKLLNLHLFQNLFDELTEEDFSDYDYSDIYSSIYSLLLKMRLNTIDEEIKTEEEALQEFLKFINTQSKDLFITKSLKQEYLLIKTILYKRLNKMNKSEIISKDIVDSKVVLDEGLPLMFYVRRKDDRSLLKSIVKKNHLNVNLNILKYQIDSLKTHEEFLKSGKKVLYDYLEEGLNQDIAEDDYEEILANFRDLLEKIPKTTERGKLIQMYSIRFVYFKFHFNYIYDLEQHEKENSIINMERLPFLRVILETVFDFYSDDQFERVKAIFSAVQLSDHPLENVFEDLQAFFEENINPILTKFIKPSIENNFIRKRNLCAEILNSFHMFVSPEKRKNLKPITSACEGIENFYEVASFRRKYFFIMIKWLSLARIFEDYRNKKHLHKDFVEMFISVSMFKTYGITLENSRFHYSLEYDFYLNSESQKPNVLADFQGLTHQHRFTYFDIIKISNIRNLLPTPSILHKTLFAFIYFKKMANVLRFFNLQEGSNLSLFNHLYSQFKSKPRFYHLNNVYLLLNLQRQQDFEGRTPLINRLTAEYQSVNVFSQELIPKDHERNQVLASRIAVIFFYTIYLQTCDETKCEGETHGANWKKFEDFLQTILTNEDSRVRLYFFTDYLYDDMSTDLYKNSYENRPYSESDFINEASTDTENFPVHVLNRRILTSWAVEKLQKLNYKNSPSRYLENVTYDYFKELLRGQHLERAEEFKEIMIQNVLAYHRRNGHKVFSDLHTKLLSSLKPNRRIPTQMNMDLVMFNCISEFVSKMNSPDKKYHRFQESVVRQQLQIFIILYFKHVGLMYNEKLHMPKTDQYLNIKMYNLPHIVSLYSIFGMKLTDNFKSDTIFKYMNNTEFLGWAQFSIDSHITAINDVEEFKIAKEEKLQHIRRIFKTHELNNLTTQNLEGFFHPICHFEDALVSSRFIEKSEYLKRLENIVPECMEIAKKSGPTDAKIIIFKLLKIFYMPQKYYKESVIVFENDPLPDWLSSAKKLFVRITMTAQELVDFYEFAQMIQKILSSQAKVINANFQTFFSSMVSGHNLDNLTNHLSSQLASGGLLDIDNKLLSEDKVNTLKQYYSNTVLYDIMTLMPITKDTFQQNKKLWSYDFFHLLNRKSSYSAFLTNLFQNYSPENPASFHNFYFLVCKFKLVRLLTEKAKNKKLERSSNIDSAMNAHSIAKFQEEITRTESPIFNSFLNKLINSEKQKEKKDLDLITQLYYFKITNLDINIVDMGVFEQSDDYAVNIVEDVRDFLTNSDSVQKEILHPILVKDSGLSNNLSFYYQEVNKLKKLIDRYGEIDDKFENTNDQDLKDNYSEYLKKYVDIFESKYGLTVSEDDTIMYQRNLKTLLFKFDSKVVF
jgi:hypothetical protein